MDKTEDKAKKKVQAMQTKPTNKVLRSREIEPLLSTVKCISNYLIKRVEKIDRDTKSIFITYDKLHQ